MSKSIYSWEGRPASRSRLQDFGRDLATQEETSPLHFVASLTNISQNGWSGKTYPASCHPTEDGTLEPSSGRWANSGMGGPIESWTLSSSEWPSDADVCLLSDVLETGPVPQRYFLSAKACQGILRRAEKRGKRLPSALQAAIDVQSGTFIATQRQFVQQNNVNPEYYDNHAQDCRITGPHQVGKTVSAKYGTGGGNTPIVTHPQGGGINEEVCFTQNATDRHGEAQQMAVRRLTPVECERLQGFPDNYTRIAWRKKQPEDCPDGPRYKALGNSMAVPVMRWIGSKINLKEIIE